MKVDSIRQRLVILTVSVLVIALLGSLLIALRAFNTTLRETTYTRLSDQSDYLASRLLEIAGSAEDLGQKLNEIYDTYAHDTKLRITAIDPVGTVIYDSDYDVKTMDNHLWRPEVQKALTTGYGTSERRSDTQDLPVLYHALRIDGTDEVAVIRVSTTLDQLLGYQQIYRRLFLSGLLVLLLLAGLVTAISIAMITRPLHKIKVAAGRYAEGDFDAPLRIDSPKELADLASTMREMAIQLKQTLAEVKEGRARLETLLESMTEGIVLIDSDMVIRVANTASGHLLFNSREMPIEGRSLSHLISSTDIIETCSQTMHDGKANEFTIARFGHLFGETARLAGRHNTKTLRISTVPVYRNTDITGVVMTINDMTEKQRMEQMRKDFVANVSHELKTPITAIAGFSSLLLEGGGENPQELSHFMGIINRQAQNMQRIVEDLLLLSSLEQQSAKPTCTWTTAEQLIDETIESCRYRAEEKEITITTEIVNPDDLELWVNSMLIVQAMANLVVNAITYSEAKSTVAVRVALDVQQAVITVADSGCGIPKEAHQRIFERFYRVDAGRSRSLGGTGLGLSIVKHIVSVHGGVVSMESEMGKGSTFTITLPRSSTDLEKLQIRSDALYQRETP